MYGKRFVTGDRQKACLFEQKGSYMASIKDSMGNSRRCSLEPIDPWRSSSFSLPRPLPDTTCGPLPRSRE